jgi:hypothetical protein
MSLEDAVAFLVALALPLWLLVEQGALWMAASGAEKRATSRSRSARRVQVGDSTQGRLTEAGAGL